MDTRLLVRPRSCSGNSKNGTLSFVFKPYIRVVTSSRIRVVTYPMLTTVIHAETLDEPIVISGLSPEDAQTRSLSFMCGTSPVWTSSATHDERGGSKWT